MKPEQERRHIQQARADPRAFEHLYDHYFPRIHAYVRYRVRRRQDAEDIIAEVFLTAMRRVGGFEWRHQGSFAAWIFRIAHNLVVDYYRQYGQVEILGIGDAIREPGSDGSPKRWVPFKSRALQPEEVLTQRETFRQMRALIETLSPRRQEVITLRFFGGLRNKEIADILDLDERTIASHLSRGLQDLRDRYTAQTSLQVFEEVNV